VRPRVFKEVTLKSTVKLWAMPNSLEEGHCRRVDKKFKMEMEHKFL